MITAGYCFRFVPAPRLDRGAVAALNADQPIQALVWAVDQALTNARAGDLGERDRLAAALRERVQHADLL